MTTLVTTPVLVTTPQNDGFWTPAITRADLAAVLDRFERIDACFDRGEEPAADWTFPSEVGGHELNVTCDGDVEVDGLIWACRGGVVPGTMSPYVVVEIGSGRVHNLLDA